MGYSPRGCKDSDTTELLSRYTFLPAVLSWQSRGFCSMYHHPAPKPHPYV